MRIIRAKSLGKKRYKSYEFSGAWLASFGEPEKQSRWIIYGLSGQGKTEFCAQLTQYVSQFGRVLYVSAEQGASKSLNLAWTRHGLTDNARVYLAIEARFTDILNLIKEHKTKPKTIIIDSMDYLKITAEEYQKLHEIARGIMLVFVSWGEGKHPKSSEAKKVEFMTDVKVQVRNFVAFPRSRFGGNKPFVIWNERACEYHSFLNR